MFSSLMSCYISLLVAVLALLTAVVGSTSDVMKRNADMQTPAEKLIESVPMAERTPFLFYQLALALNSTKILPDRLSPRLNLQASVLSSKEAEKFMAIPTYKSFAPDLLNWVMEDFTVSEDDVYGMMGSRDLMLCTVNGLCFSGNDIGSYCCPF